MRVLVIAGVVVIAMSGCARTAVEDLSRNTFQVNTTAAPACGSQGARSVARQAAAIEVIRRGGDRYIIAGGQSGSEFGGVLVQPVSPVTPFGGVTAINRPTTEVIVKMLTQADPEFANGLSARQTLGPDWQKIVADGTPNTC